MNFKKYRSEIFNKKFIIFAKNKQAMKKIFIIILIAFAMPVFGQTPMPIEIVITEEAKFVISGVGNGNLGIVNSVNNISGNIAFDFADENFFVSLRYAPNATTGFNYQKDFDGSKLNLLQRDVNFSLETGLKPKNERYGKPNFLPYAGISYSMPNATGMDSLNNLTKGGFSQFYINIGTKFGYYTQTKEGKVGFSFTPRIYYLNFQNEKDRALENLLRYNVDFNKNYIGLGIKGIVQVNNFGFIFDYNRNYSFSENNMNIDIPAFAGKNFFTFGLVAIGEAFNW